MRSDRHHFATRFLGPLAVVCATLLSGCASDEWGFPYRVGTQQGNWITQQQVDSLFQGMTREQVRYALGTPMLTSALHRDRWDYPYFYEFPDRSTEKRNFSVFFDGDFLSHWDGDAQPSLEPFQIAREEVEESQDDQAHVELDAERAASAVRDSGESVFQVGPDVTVDTDVTDTPQPATPYVAPGTPDIAPVPLD